MHSKLTSRCKGGGYVGCVTPQGEVTRQSGEVLGQRLGETLWIYARGINQRCARGQFLEVRPGDTIAC
jgi:hypothetical protein